MKVNIYEVYIFIGGNFEVHSMYYLRGDPLVPVDVEDTAKTFFYCLNSRVLPLEVK